MGNPVISYAARSDMGRVRRNNEDNLLCCGQFMSEDARDLPYKTSGHGDAPMVFAVCDGMGGYQSGEKASLTAVQVLAEFSKTLCGCQTDRLDALTQQYVSAVNQRIQQAAQLKTAKMGTTIALVIILNEEIRAYNIGDSRIYALDKNGFRRLSVDHTLAMRKVKLGLLTEAQARQSGEWHKLTACLGFFDSDGNDFMADALPPIKLNGRVRLLLCSDGLTDVLTDNRIERILRSHKNAERTVLQFISEALDNGGTDNVTAIVADVRRGKLPRLMLPF